MADTSSRSNQYFDFLRGTVWTEVELLPDDLVVTLSTVQAGPDSHLRRTKHLGFGGTDAEAANDRQMMKPDLDHLFARAFSGPQ